MLKSTHKAVGGPPPLLKGWTEHKAPAGHSYYYNSTTKESTYSRPQENPSLQQELSGSNLLDGRDNNVSGFQGSDGFQSKSTVLHRDRVFPFRNGLSHRQNGHFHREGGNDTRGGAGFQDRRRPSLADRPRTKHAIPNCEAWILVRTKLGRRFVYNLDNGESYWKFPPEVMRCVIEYDRMEREKREKKERSAGGEHGEETVATDQDLPVAEADTAAQPKPAMPVVGGRGDKDDSDEYEEVEVTDDEDEGNPSKRQKLEDGNVDDTVEFNEDDIAYQLAAMGQEYGLDPGEYGDGEDQGWEEGAEGLPLTEEDSDALFRDMLEDHHVSPYTPWENIVDEGKIVEDDRYTVLPNMKTRKDVWAKWTRDKTQQIKEQRAKEEKKDPRIPYLAFIQKYATPKLYWPEFRRKYKKEVEMKDVKVSDKEREKWYRDYINRLKLSESSLKSDLTTLLKSLPLHILNRSTSLDALPSELLTDIRYISLRSSVRDPLIEAYIATSPPALEQSDFSLEAKAEMAKQRTERERRERALTERENKVQEEKIKQRGQLQFSKGMLRGGEEEILKALRVGRGGLLSQLEASDQSQVAKTI